MRCDKNLALPDIRDLELIVVQPRTIFLQKRLVKLKLITANRMMVMFLEIVILVNIINSKNK